MDEKAILDALETSTFWPKRQIIEAIWGAENPVARHRMIYIGWLANDNTSNLPISVKFALIHRLSREN